MFEPIEGALNPVAVLISRCPIRTAPCGLRIVLGETFQGNLPLYIALEGHQPDRLKDPVLLAKLDRLQTVVEQDPIVGGSLSLAEYIKRMNRVMNEDQPEMEVIPDSQDLIAQYLLLYSFSGDPDDFDEIVDYDYQHANMTVFLRSDSTQDIERVVGIVQDFAVREFGQTGDSGTADTGSQDPWSIRFGRWLAGIDTDGYWLGNQQRFSAWDCRQWLSDHPFQRTGGVWAVGQSRRLTRGRLFIDGVDVSLLGRWAD